MDVDRIPMYSHVSLDLLLPWHPMATRGLRKWPSAVPCFSFSAAFRWSSRTESPRHATWWWNMVSTTAAGLSWVDILQFSRAPELLLSWCGLCVSLVLMMFGLLFDHVWDDDHEWRRCFQKGFPQVWVAVKPDVSKFIQSSHTSVQDKMMPTLTLQPWRACSFIG